MTSTTARQRQPFISRQWQRFQNWFRNMYRQAFRRGDFEALFIGFGLLLFPILALNETEWVGGMLILIPVTIIALFVSHLLARSGFSEGYALILTMLYGFATVITAHLMTLSGGLSPVARLNELTLRLRTWSDDINAGEPGAENLVFTMFLSILFWLLAHNTIWHVIRLDRVWRAIIPAGMLLIIVNVLYVGDENLDIFVLGFLFFALLLVVHNNTRNREYEWRKNRMSVPSRIHRSFIRMGAVISIIVLLFTGAISGAGQDNMDQFEDFLESDPITAVTELWSRLFADLDGRGIATTDYYGGDRLDLTGAVQLSDEPVMSITVQDVPAGARFYWRSTVFDTYDGRGWEHQRSVRAFKESDGMTFNTGNYASRRNIFQDITMLIRSTSLVHAVPQPVRIDDITVEAELDCVTGSSNCINDNTETDVSIIRSRDALRRDDTYSAISSVSVATADELRSAGTTYPAWVTDSYLQGASLVSERTRLETQRIVDARQVDNPYDIAKAVEQYLRTITYNESIPAPPFNADPIDWFLYDIQQGYCTYYATSMVMMLRTQGIPARMATGFAQGDIQGTGRYLVRENDAHTWVEVYFPGYGWVNFEPTADELPVDRPGDPQFDDLNLETPEPTPSPSPEAQESTAPPPAIPTATPTPTLTPTSTQEPVAQAPAITATPEFQPTQTPFPSPSPTLPPAPELTSVAADEESNFLETILLVLLIVVISITTLILMALFAVWWVEHRGLGGLNPIQKAYARLVIYSNWLGIRLNKRQTPHERRSVLIDAVPEGREPINTITDLYTHDRFAPPMPENYQDESENMAKEAWQNARGVFIRRKFNRRNKRR